jgi:catechol 2,3-dioxygenase-like lactoylglutathione lyase family enzyme
MDHIEFLARDLEETIEFYVNVLGFKHGRRTISTRPDGSRVEQACVVLDDFMIELFQASPEAIEAGWDPGALGVKTFALRVDDMAATVAELVAHGVVISREPRPGSSFEGLRGEMLDPNGVSIELREWQGGDSYHVEGWEPASDAVTLVR